MQHVVVLMARGGSDIGVGHLSRTATLASALQRTGQYQQVLLCWQTTTELAAQFAAENCDLQLVPGDSHPAAQLQAIRQQADCLTLVTDLLHLSEEDIARYRKQGCDAIVHINDSGPGRWHADMVVDGDAFKSTRDVPETFPGVALVGASYRMIRESVVQVRPDTPWNESQVQRLLLTFGGADPHDLTAELLNAMAASPEELPFAIQVVIGPAFSINHQQRLQACVDSRPGMTVERTGQLASLLLQNDLVVTLGGITAYEVMCLGRPCVALHCPETGLHTHQLAADKLLFEFDSATTAAAQLVALSRNISALQEYAQRGWTHIDGQGAERVSRAILSMKPV